MTARELLLDHDEKFIVEWIEEHQLSENLDLDIPVFRKDPIIQKKGRGYLLIHSLGVVSIRARDDYRLFILPVAQLGRSRLLNVNEMEFDLLIVDLRNGQLSYIKPLK